MPADFAGHLAAAGLKGPELRRWAERLSGMPIARSTIPRWKKGERQPDPWAVVLLAVIKNPELIEELRSGDPERPPLSDQRLAGSRQLAD